MYCKFLLVNLINLLLHCENFNNTTKRTKYLSNCFKPTTPTALNFKLQNNYI